MLVKSVTIYVKTEHINEFIQATIENQIHSLKEDGISQFEVLQCTNDPSRFLLYEVYQSEDAINAHLQTAHFKKWIDTVTQWFVGPRDRAVYTPVSNKDI
jgi:autoinducer 2-degrading protein